MFYGYKCQRCGIPMTRNLRGRPPKYCPPCRQEIQKQWKDNRRQK